MFFEKGNMVTAIDENGRSYTGTILTIVIQNCKDDCNRPHALLFISQDKRFIDKEGEFGCISLWVDKLHSIVLI